MAEAASEAVSSVPCHLEGITRICFSTDGNTIFTGGTDSLVRIHNANDPDSEPGFYDEHTDAITSLTCSTNNLITASRDNISRIFTYPENQFAGYLTRATAVPIRWVSVDKQGARVAVCSDDLLVKIVDLQDPTKVSFLSDNTKTVRSASWDPTGKFLVTAGCDGRVKVYDMSTSPAVHLKNIEGAIATSESDSEVSCYAAWHPSGDFFALPLRTHDIGIYSKGGWQKQTSFSQDGHKGTIAELAWSPNGRYLASTSSSQILIWETDSRTVVARHKYIGYSSICGLTWAPKSNMLAFTSLDGQFSRWANPVPKGMTSPFASDKQVQKRVDRLLDDDDEGGRAGGGGDDVDLDIDDDEERGEELGDDEDEAGDWIVDDDGEYGRDDAKWGKGRQEVVNVTKAQPAFTPGSTAFRSKKRYLAFNMIGVVDATEVETHQVINVEFHDRSLRKGYHFQDHSGYTMASLGEQGIAYASPASEGSPSTIHYRPYDSWATQADWTQTLPAGENVTCVAVGGPAQGQGVGSVIVSTSRGLLRFFTASGVQRYIWRLGEDVVSMTAGKEGLMVVHREGGTSLDGCQNLRYTVMDLETFDVLQDGRVPLPRKVTLTWLGWSAVGAPVIADSSGVVSQLDRYRRPGQARWVPILDAAARKKEADKESYWPVGVKGSHLTCITLRGAEKEPWFPRPLLQEIELHVPLLGLDGQTGKLEESILRNQLSLSLLTSSLSSSADHEIKETRILIDRELLQLVQSACKSDNLARAYDLTSLMLNPASVDAAAKIASFYHLGGLEERILDLRGEAGSRARREEKRGKEREKERERRYGADYSANGSGGRAGAGSGAGAADLGFQPRDKPRRSFGGVNRRAETPASSMNTAGGRVKETYIPETPTGESSFTAGGQANGRARGAGGFDGDDGVEDDEETQFVASPEGKRKRDEEEFAPRKRGEDIPSTNGSAAGKNPFAKKAAGAGNPFARAAAAKPLDSIKSTSFFDRVDDIEMSGASKNKSKNPLSKRPVNVGASSSGSGQGKQTTLLGMKKKDPSASTGPTASRPSLPHHASSTETEGASTEIDPDGDFDMNGNGHVDGGQESEPEGAGAMALPSGAARKGVIVEETQAQLDDEGGHVGGNGLHAQGPEEDDEEEREGSPDWDEGVEETVL